MFTGIVEEVGTVAAIERDGGNAVLTVACDIVVSDVRLGDSIAVNGCCLTVTTLPEGGGFSADLMGETLDRTALGALGPGAPVNLERALPATGRLGGHIVQGHVDGVARVTAVARHDGWTEMTFTLPETLAPYLVEKGSITVDGISLTVLRVDAGTFAVGLIPHTLEVTTLGRRTVGDAVNLEADIVAKYVQRMLSLGAESPYAFGGDPAGVPPGAGNPGAARSDVPQKE